MPDNELVYPELEVDGFWGTCTTEMLQGVLGAMMGDNGPCRVTA